MATTIDIPSENNEVIDKAVIRFCGDSGDGMQISGTSSPIPWRCTEMTWPLSLTIPPKFAPLRARCRA